MSNIKKITDIKGNTKEIGCLSCAIQNKEVKSPGGSIVSTKYFDAQQDYEIPIPGFVILVSKRHLQSIDEFTDDEKNDFIDFIIKLRRCMRESLNIQVVYLIQEEDTSHHFHMWMFPRYDWMKKEFGKKIQSVWPIMEYAKKSLKTKENLMKVEEATTKMQDYFNKVAE